MNIQRTTRRGLARIVVLISATMVSLALATPAYADHRGHDRRHEVRHHVHHHHKHRGHGRGHYKHHKRYHQPKRVVHIHKHYYPEPTRQVQHYYEAPPRNRHYDAPPVHYSPPVHPRYGAHHVNGGSLVGAAVGGLLGAQVGGGSGQLAATAAGTLAGFLLGNEVQYGYR